MKKYLLLFFFVTQINAQWNPSNSTIPAPGDCVSAYRICDATQTYNFELLNAGVIDDANGMLGIPGLNKSTPTTFESKSCFIEFIPQYSGQFGLSICPETHEDLSIILFQNPDCSALQTGNYSISTQANAPINPTDACTGFGLNPYSGVQANDYDPYVNVFAGNTYMIFVSVEWYTQPGTHKFTLSFQGAVVTAHPDLFDITNCNLATEEFVTNDDIVTISPNPFATSFTINTLLTFEKLALYDVTGKLVHTQNYQNKVEIKNLSQGVYILHLIDNEGYKVVKKLVKE